MIKNKRGQTLGLSIISSFVILIIGLVVINLLTPSVDSTREDLSCSDVDNISDGTKILCLVVDLTVIYWILIIFSVILGGITSRSVSRVAARLVT